MGRVKMKAKGRRDYTSAHVFQLVVGRDFFGDAFGGDVEAMREAWADPAMRQRVDDMAAERQRPHRPREPWAHFVFDLGLPGFPESDES